MVDFLIKKIKNSNGDEVNFCPSRGGIITSLNLRGKEVLYFDVGTFKNVDEAVRGGIPILFPNAGELSNNIIFPNLKRHGFARDLAWNSFDQINEFRESVVSNEKTQSIYPYDFKLTFSGGFDDSGAFIFSQEVENLEQDKKMPISMGLHPYFNVHQEEKKNVKFNFEGGSEIEEKFEVWANGGTVYVDNPKIKNKEASLNIHIPSIGDIIVDVDVEYKKIWVWSLPNRDFICIEPMMGELNGLIDNPKSLKPKEIFKTGIKICLA